ncbi:MAG: HDOD domain-containing protein [Epulopiscium sp.]|nr:HDOD domain-containing protein [Candidatus Epulonipiscium sp.]
MTNHTIIQEIEASGRLPQIPEHFGTIFKMLFDPYKHDLSEYEEQFSNFPQLEENLLKVLNEVLNPKNKIRTAKDALNYLGVKNTKIISISYITKLLLAQKKPGTHLFDSDKYWKHCVGTAISAYLIAEETKLAADDRMFIHGLIHDIGVTVLEICLPDLLEKIQELVLKGVHQIAAEKLVLGGLTHGMIGMWLCEKWELPGEIQTVVGYHHRPLLTQEYIIETKIMHLADSISTSYYESLIGCDSTFVYAEMIMEDLDVDKKFVDELLDKLPKEVQRLNRILVI